MIGEGQWTSVSKQDYNPIGMHPGSSVQREEAERQRALLASPNSLTDQGQLRLKSTLEHEVVPNTLTAARREPLK